MLGKGGTLKFFECSIQYFQYVTSPQSNEVGQCAENGLRKKSKKRGFVYIFCIITSK